MAASGGKLNKVSSTPAVAATTDACVTMCADAQVDCVNAVICEKSAVSIGGLRHLLASSDTSLVINPKVTLKP